MFSKLLLEFLAQSKVYTLAGSKVKPNRKGSDIYFLVQAKGLEPPCREALDPKSSASTNFATPAYTF